MSISGYPINPVNIPSEQDLSDSQISHPLSEVEQVALVTALRKQAVANGRENFAQMASPIRAMARMVKEVEREALNAGISPEIMAREVVNRTIGDVNVRWITEKVDGVDYTTIGEDLGLILPGEEIGGRISDGRVHHELNRRAEEIERKLLRDYDWDMRVYDVYGVGNPYLRERLVARFERAWGIPADPEKTYISIGALDALGKCIMSFAHHFREKYHVPPTMAFP